MCVTLCVFFLQSFPILLGDVDPSGNLNANIIHAFSRNSLTRLVAQVCGLKRSQKNVN